jgi:hypothetical protein
MGERHADTRRHCYRAEYRAHHTLTEIFPRQHRIERHQAAIGAKTGHDDRGIGTE